MEVTLPLTSILIIAIGCIGVFISIATSIFILFKKRDDHIFNYFLSFLLLSTGLSLFNEILTISGLANRFQNLYFIPTCYTLSIAPLFYLFVKTKYNNKFSKIDGLHLILPVIQAIVYFSIGFRDIAFKSYLWENPQFRIFLGIESFLFPIGLFVYSLMALYILRKPSTKEFFWDADLKNWLTSYVKVFIFITFLELFVLIIELVFGQRLGAGFYVLRVLIFVSFILWIVYNAIKLLNPNSIYQSKPNETSIEVNEEEVLRIKNLIISLMDQDKIFLNSDLTVKILAGYIGTTEKKCSNALRTGFDINFNTLINSYRVAAFKEQVNQGKHKELTLLSIAYDCGFESKSTFNRSFKNIVGLTPTQYIKTL